MINAQMLDNFRGDFAQAVKSLEQKYGIIIELGRITYGSDHFRASIECKEGSDKDEAEERNFKKRCKYYGLMPEDYDRRITIKEKGVDVDYIITGIDESRRKYPIMIRRVSDCVDRLAPAELIKRVLGR